MADTYTALHSMITEGIVRPGDPVIVSWSERTRVLRNMSTRRRAPAEQHDVIFNWRIYDAMVRDAEWLCREQASPLLVIWSFPSTWPQCLDPNRPTVASVKTWDREFYDQDPDCWGYTESLGWQSEIRPALYWFSMQDHPDAKSFLASMGVRNDPRPNHIKNSEVHQRLAQCVGQWITGQWKGCRDLRAQ